MISATIAKSKPIITKAINEPILFKVIGFIEMSESHFKDFAFFIHFLLTL